MNMRSQALEKQAAYGKGGSKGMPPGPDPPTHDTNAAAGMIKRSG